MINVPPSRVSLTQPGQPDLVLALGCEISALFFSATVFVVWEANCVCGEAVTLVVLQD